MPFFLHQARNKLHPFILVNGVDAKRFLSEKNRINGEIIGAAKRDVVKTIRCGIENGQSKSDIIPACLKILNEASLRSLEVLHGELEDLYR